MYELTVKSEFEAAHFIKDYSGNGLKITANFAQSSRLTACTLTRGKMAIGNAVGKFLREKWFNFITGAEIKEWEFVRADG